MLGSLKFVLFWIACLVWLLGCTHAPNRNKMVSSEMNCCGPLIKGICAASYFYPNNARYITKQTHLFCPCSQSLQIQSNEPAGMLMRKLNNNIYSVIGPSEISIQDSHLDGMLSRILYHSMIWAAQMHPDDGTTPGEPQRIEGQWYVPVVVNRSPFTITLLKSNQTGINNLVTIHDDNTALLAQIYNFRHNKSLNKNIPYTIDVFDMKKGLSSKRLLLQIQYTDMEVRD